jgi:hypothetical protein
MHRYGCTEQCQKSNAANPSGTKPFLIPNPYNNSDTISANLYSTTGSGASKFRGSKPVDSAGK